MFSWHFLQSLALHLPYSLYFADISLLFLIRLALAARPARTAGLHLLSNLVFFQLCPCKLCYSVQAALFDTVCSRAQTAFSSICSPCAKPISICRILRLFACFLGLHPSCMLRPTPNNLQFKLFFQFLFSLQPRQHSFTALLKFPLASTLIFWMQSQPSKTIRSHASQHLFIFCCYFVRVTEIPSSFVLL